MGQDGDTQLPADSDPLVRYSREIVFGLGLVAVVLLILSLKSNEFVQLPGIAFGWKVGLDITRSAIVLAIVALVATVLIRGWGGVWPQRVSATGFDYERLIGATAQVAQLLTRLEVLETEIGRVREEKGLPR